MPRCIDWRASDWQYAIDAARLAALWHRFGKTKYEAVLRAREKVRGVTADSRGASSKLSQPQAEDDDGARRALNMADFRHIVED